MFHGIAPTRRHVNVAEFTFYRFANRRVTEISGTDHGELLGQLGT